MKRSSAVSGMFVVFAVLASACVGPSPTPFPPNFPPPSSCDGFPASLSCPPQITLSEWAIARTDIPAHNHVETTPAGGVKVATEGKPGHQHDQVTPDRPLYVWELGSVTYPWFNDKLIPHDPGAKGGYVWLDVRNHGNKVHGLAIWKGGQVVGDKVEEGSLVGEFDLLQPGEVIRFKIYLEESTYILNDPLAGHTQKGMHLTIIAKGKATIAEDTVEEGYTH